METQKQVNSVLSCLRSNSKAKKKKKKKKAANVLLGTGALKWVQQPEPNVTERSPRKGKSKEPPIASGECRHCNRPYALFRYLRRFLQELSTEHVVTPPLLGPANILRLRSPLWGIARTGTWSERRQTVWPSVCATKHNCGRIPQYEWLHTFPARYAIESFLNCASAEIKHRFWKPIVSKVCRVKQKFILLNAFFLITTLMLSIFQR